MSNNLDLAQVAPSQNNKETTINDQAGQLDAALAEVLTIGVDETNAYVLSASQLRRNVSSWLPKDHLRPRQRSRSRRRRPGGVCRSPRNAVMIRLIASGSSAAGGVPCYL
jgi:hypothetical protein